MLHHQLPLHGLSCIMAFGEALFFMLNVIVVDAQGGGLGAAIITIVLIFTKAFILRKY